MKMHHAVLVQGGAFYETSTCSFEKCFYANLTISFIPWVQSDILELLAKYKDLRSIYITCGGVAQVGEILKECNRQDGIKVVCFEDYPEILELLKEGVIDCTLSGDIQRQGSLPIELVMEYLVFGRLPEKHHIFTETRVLLKESIF